MNPKRRPSSPNHRVLTFLVGFTFLVALVTAQLPFCQCGIQCLHVAFGAAEAFAEPAGEADHPCCPGDGEHGAPAPQPSDKAPCDDENGQCPCPVQIQQDDSQTPAAPAPTVEPLPIKQILSTPVEQSAAVTLFPAPAPARRWEPIRGSPPTGQPIHLLNSVFII